ncbi:MAG: glycosyltransferase family 4 protein [Verrucomicrobiae bacterium]|nr:glycosyltransferase family 4 protein [Verrucomicrobiae bacterium]
MKTLWLLRRRYDAAGGGERFAARLIRALASRGWRVRVVAEEWPETGDERVSVVRVPTRSPAAFARAWIEHLAPAAEGVVFSLERTARQHLYRAGDGVHATWLERRAPSRSRIGRAFASFNPKHRAVLRLERATFDPKNTGRILANSPMVRDEILARFEYPADRIEVVSAGVDLNMFAPCRDDGRRAALRARFGVPREAIAWAFVGSGFARKGLATALRLAAAQRAAPVRLLVLGRGDPGAPRRLAERLGFGERLAFLPEGTPALDVYHAADAFILPTIYDPCSNATLEAAACGLPVITTPSNGATAFVEALLLEDHLVFEEAVERCAPAVRPFDPARVKEEPRARLDERPCWDALLKQIERAES